MSTIRVTNLRDVNGNNGIVLNSGAVSVPGTLAVTGASTFTGNVTCSNLIVNGTISGSSSQYLPSQSGNNGRYLTTNGASPSWAALDVQKPDFLGLEQTSGGTRKFIAAIYSQNDRQNNSLYQWSSGGPWTTIYGYGANGQADAEQWSWLGLGFWQPGENASSVWGERSKGQSGAGNKNFLTSEGRSIGNQQMHDTYARSTSYNPVSVMLMPVRNFHPSATKTITVYGQYSNYWSSGYDGSSIWQYAPGSNGTYSISSGTWSLLTNRSSGNSYGYTWSVSVSIPPQTTYMIMQVSTMYYWTSNYNYYCFYDWNRFYNLETTFSDPYIQCDARMVNAMRFGDLYQYGMTASSGYQFYRVYQATADMYGNR